MCKPNKNTIGTIVLSNESNIINYTLQTSSQEQTLIDSITNSQYNVSTVDGSIINDNFYNDTTFDDDLSDLHADTVSTINESKHHHNLYNETTLNNNISDLYADIVHDSLYNNITLSEDSIHNVTNNSSTCAQNLVDLGLNSKGFRIGHINIQSIQNKIDQIDLMLNHSNNDVNVFGLSETKLKFFDSAFQL